MIKKIIGLFLVVIVVAVALLYLYLNVIIKTIVENQGSKALGTKVTLGFINFLPFTGDISVSSLKIASPEGFKTDYVFKLDAVDLQADMPSLKKDVVTINNVLIKNPRIYYELKGNITNIDSIKQKASSRGGNSNTEVNKKVIIKNLDIIGAEAVLATEIFGSEQKISSKIPDINLKGIGQKENGILMKEAIMQIINKFLGVAANSGQLGQLQKEANKLIDAQQKQLLNKVSEQQKKLEDKVGQEINKNLNKFLGN